VVSKTATINPVAAYRLWENPFAAIDVFGGVRIWVVDTQLKLTGDVATTRRFSDTEAWADPVVGAAIRARLWGRLFGTLLADVGGFGIVSDITWQAFVGLSYEFADRWALKVGYRALGVDYKDGAFKFDDIAYGPLIGVGYRF
jgi:opacity protein-like surface antigen